LRYLITGGVKGGKSFRALQIARLEFSTPVVFLATAEVLDEEMRQKIEIHRAERRLPQGEDEFVTVEEPLDLPGALRGLGGSGVIIDCIPLWINNLVYHQREKDFSNLLEATLSLLPANAVLVTNETGWGNIPFDEGTRRYNGLLAQANRRIAGAVDHVELMVAGIPWRVK
jgi:adenosylcobinamide kinase/adenosylcobinamide-phosphate guanylyltransferase